MKRILSLDGGGIRGMLSLQVLKEIERHFRQRSGNDRLVLSDVIDFFAGTSTGAIIATGLSWGLEVAQLEQMYLKYGPAMFSRTSWYLRWKSAYRAESIGDFFRTFFCEDDGSVALLRTRKLRTLLMVVMRNAGTGSPWPLTNNPHARFNQSDRPDCNLDIPLWQVLRASTAAPSFFPPQEIRIGDRVDLFVDGGITPYNNPALLAVLTATLPGYCLGWPTGRDQIHVISVGTGSTRTKLPPKKAAEIHMLDHLGFVAPALMSSVSANQDLLCRVLGDCRFGAPIDSEVGDLVGATLFDRDHQLFSYVRYNVALDADEKRHLSRAQTRLDNLALMPLLQEIGAEYASESVRPEHLA